MWDFFSLGALVIRQKMEQHWLFALVTIEEHLAPSYPSNLQNLQERDIHISHYDSDLQSLAASGWAITVTEIYLSL